MLLRTDRAAEQLRDHFVANPATEGPERALVTCWLLSCWLRQKLDIRAMVFSQGAAGSGKSQAAKAATVLTFGEKRLFPDAGGAADGGRPAAPRRPGQQRQPEHGRRPGAVPAVDGVRRHEDEAAPTSCATPSVATSEVVPLLDALRPYLPPPSPASQLVLPRRSVKGGRVDPERDQIVQPRKALARAGIDKAIRFHDLRHTFGMLPVRAGVDVRTVQDVLGPSTMRMTQQYVHLASDPADELRGFDLDKKSPPKG